MTVVRLSLAMFFGVVILFGVGFAIGASAGWVYGSRDKVCAEIPKDGYSVIVCDYGWEPPAEAFIR